MAHRSRMTDTTVDSGISQPSTDRIRCYFQQLPTFAFMTNVTCLESFEPHIFRLKPFQVARCGSVSCVDWQLSEAAECMAGCTWTEALCVCVFREPVLPGVHRATSERYGTASSHTERGAVCHQAGPHRQNPRL